MENLHLKAVKNMLAGESLLNLVSMFMGGENISRSPPKGCFLRAGMPQWEYTLRQSFYSKDLKIISAQMGN